MTDPDANMDRPVSEWNREQLEDGKQTVEGVLKIMPREIEKGKEFLAKINAQLTLLDELGALSKP